MQHKCHTYKTKSPVWGTMQHQCHTYKTLQTSRWCGGLCNTNATPTRLDTQVAGVGDYATLHTHTYKTRRRCGGLCNTNATPTRLDKQVASVGDYATPMPHLQDSINKSPAWGTMQHQCHTYKTRYTSRRCRVLCNTTYPRLQDSINKSPVWGTMQHQCHTYKTR